MSALVFIGLDELSTVSIGTDGGHLSDYYGCGCCCSPIISFKHVGHRQFLKRFPIHARCVSETGIHPHQQLSPPHLNVAPQRSQSLSVRCVTSTQAASQTLE